MYLELLKRESWIFFFSKTAIKKILCKNLILREHNQRSYNEFLELPKMCYICQVLILINAARIVNKMVIIIL